MDANDLTFGIEIETTLPVDSTPIGGHGHGVQIPWLPAGWLADRDPSITYRHGRMPCEVVSPVLKGEEGLTQLIGVLYTLRAHGARPNDSTGLHIHVGWSGDAAALTRLVTLVANFEKAIFATTGTKAREHGRWCHGLQRYGQVASALAFSQQDRYHVLNLRNLATGRRPTVEFRAFAGTTNTDKIISYIRICLGLVERALKAQRVTNFTAKQVAEKSPIHRSGEGQTALTRLFYQLGWIKGRTNYIYGNVSAAAAPTFKTVKRELMRLARKYDTEARC